MKKETVRNESTKTDKKELNTNALTVIVRNNGNGEVLVEQNVASIIFAGITHVEKEGNTLNAGVAGEFSINTLMQSLESVTGATTEALIEQYDIDVETYIAMMGKLVSNMVSRNFSKEDQMMGMLKTAARMSSKLD